MSSPADQTLQQLLLYDLTLWSRRLNSGDEMMKASAAELVKRIAHAKQN